MKLRRVSIRNFKGIEEVDLDLVGLDGAPRRLTALRGGNGAGKTSVMQAIAMTLSLATRRTRAPEELHWHGFMADRLATGGDTRVELAVEFTDDELDAIGEVYAAWAATRPPGSPLIAPGRHRVVHLVYSDGAVSALEGADAFFQFLGRYYIKVMLKRMPSIRAYFARIGDAFWFDQHRNLGSRLEDDDSSIDGAVPRTWSAGVEQLRTRLINWWAVHTSPGRNPARDYLETIQSHYDKIFPGTVFRGVEPRWADRGGEEFLFLFDREQKVYDLAEMSSGEQAVFPLLIESVRLGIRRSVVLIDELELHLHPPQQQALLRALRHIAPESQFIVTTHSPYLEDSIPDEWSYILDKGRIHE